MLGCHWDGCWERHWERHWGCIEDINRTEGFFERDQIDTKTLVEDARWEVWGAIVNQFLAITGIVYSAGTAWIQVASTSSYGHSENISSWRSEWKTVLQRFSSHNSILEIQAFLFACQRCWPVRYLQLNNQNPNWHSESDIANAMLLVRELCSRKRAEREPVDRRRLSALCSMSILIIFR